MSQREKTSKQPRYVKRESGRTTKVLGSVISITAAVLSCWLTVQLLAAVITSSGLGGTGNLQAGSGTTVMDRYDTYVNNALADALEDLEGFERPKKSYWLTDDVQIAPEPDPERFGSTRNPGDLEPILARAERLLGITDTLFSTDVKLYGNSEIVYYLDETILCITWQELIDNAVYSFSEVKIAHPSQFRRFLADGTYGSDKLYYTTEMAATVNAVTASSGDFYKYRSMGVIVYNGEVKRVNDQVDTCYIDEGGNMLFTRIGEITTMEQAQQFVADNKIRFSLGFGPMLVRDEVNVAPSSYLLGEVYKKYSRAALAQMGELHYVMMTVNLSPDEGYRNTLTITELADFMMRIGAKQAYALDGGQTAALVMHDRLVNRPDYGTQRKISDIIYFATAIPENE